MMKKIKIITKKKKKSWWTKREEKNISKSLEKFKDKI